MKEWKEVEFDTEEIAEFLFMALTERGMVPSKEELEEIADIVFDYLIHKGIVDEQDIEEI